MHLNRSLYFFPALIWAGIILWLSLLPGNDLPKWRFFEIIFIDKWVHIFLHLILALLLFAGAFFIRRSSPSGTTQFYFIAICMLYGTLIEILQETLTTTRHFEWGDIAVDTVGAVLGIVLSRYMLKKKNFITRT